MKIKEIIKKHEGFRDQVYLCSEGFRTIGYGHKVLDTDPFKDGEVYPKEMLDKVFDEDFEKARKGAERLLDHLDPPQPAVDVIISMVFQLGEGGVSKFKNMFAALEEEDYVEAASQMLDSKWHVQTPARCQELANMMRNCDL